MKLISVCTPSHEPLKERWLLRTLKDDYEVCMHACDVRGAGNYLDVDWSRAVLFKSATIVRTIEENWGGVFVYSDVDVAFFGRTEPQIVAALTDKDIVCQLDDPTGNLCTGFFAARANDATLQLWRDVHEAVARERRDQPAFNRLVRMSPRVRAGYLPRAFFGTGTFAGRLIRDREPIYVPPHPTMFHANFTVGVAGKHRLLGRIEQLVTGDGWVRAANNFTFRISGGEITKRAADALIGRSRVKPLPADAAVDLASAPTSVALDVSTACQLKCPSCPTATGEIARSLGAGFLTFERFKEFVEKHPWVSDIELSNWGEVFLNPDLERILAHAHTQHVALRIENGANLDRVSDRVLEAVVKYRLRRLSCSIDGATQPVYERYRVRGELARVLDHIRRINAFKAQYRRSEPVLQWQFVAFGHNTHEIAQARDLARELGMEFRLKLSWDDLYADGFSPVVDRDLVRRESGLGVADRREYEDRFRRSYIAPTCHQLWLRPRVNFDGRVLGCSVNHWGDFGNAFDDGLEACLTGEKMRRTREMLVGLREPDESSPCSRCKVYLGMRASGQWVRPADVWVPPDRARHVKRLLRRVAHPRISAFAWRLYRRSVDLYARSA
jgi:MoaA/NifB/PqqE/SkfB family radical SAM enzyme